MRPEYDVMGVFVPTLMLLGLVCYGLFRMLHHVLAQRGLYRHVWHPALFDIALYFTLLGAAGYLLEFVTP
ncbi:DUF1656 domain-containing protein [Thioclava sp. GXIMD2076]|uniref:DUF1656 domain-containing protein n=1 Tax=Thioclava kandeliae TaxID=3070818 RepID=A0ABV1SF87_9RHOB